MRADAELLSAFRADRSEAAFAEIVARHGGMVWRSALRSLGDAQEAEDAAQAAFLMLAQHPERVGGSLATWLYHAVRKTAFVARRTRQRRCKREETAAIMPTTFPTLDGELREEIDAALEQLPEYLREAVILCHLEGREQHDAARQAGCSQATISRRSTEGLQQLGSILRKRGITAGAVAVSALLATEAAAAPPAFLSAAQLLAGKASPAAGSLAQATWTALTWAGLKAKVATLSFMSFLLVLSCVILSTPTAPLSVIVPPAVVKADPVVVPLARERAVFDHSDRVISVAFSRDGKTIASAGADRRIQLYDAFTGKLLGMLTGHHFPIKCVAFSPDGVTLASGDAQGEVKLWNAATGSERTTLRPNSTVNVVAFSPDGCTLAVGFAKGTVELWDLQAGKRRAVLRGHADMVHCLAFSGDGQTLASGSRDRTVRLWDVVAGRERRTLAGHADAVCAVAFAPDNTILIVGSGRSLEEVWQAMTIVPERGGKTAAVTTWDTATGQRRQSFSVGAAGVYALAVSPNGKLLVVGTGDALVKLWNLDTRKELGTLTGHTALVRSLMFAPDGLTLASASHDLTVRVWEVAPPK